ncbi:hypothetical protein Ahy_Scaffold1g106758 isoform C [Arachis hypogaea]|uniref:ZF-HD dimerization-type domain-containing protein n=1 Tax=Arachis hypogaea TaxID=3818 RepID=A0A444WRW9_ARAHY|nr:hypothetical protein Ahy_Scaffold1g106758 isoform C [Arachis hypogaea]
MPSGEEGTPESLRCAACECHRNFHRREVEGSAPQQHHNYYPNNNNNKHNGHSTHHLLQFHTPPPSSSLHHKRFRTKFTQQQKDRMMEFAEKLGWKIQKHDEQEVQQFCSQVGVKRQVFKVWMHNNKQAIKKQQQQHT